ncbi:unnamed protein product [Acanthosepion pharaonis]|uniref:Uncharacterized protein n=1 Tax=Acanthosepion pharaonis TaxID=158019 RepID=A0A812BDZ1_ACAPH|nr:unnamed protein product [Sepia pharaonis]
MYNATELHLHNVLWRPMQAGHVLGYPPPAVTLQQMFFYLLTIFLHTLFPPLPLPIPSSFLAPTYVPPRILFLLLLLLFLELSYLLIISFTHYFSQLLSPSLSYLLPMSLHTLFTSLLLFLSHSYPHPSSFIPIFLPLSIPLVFLPPTYPPPERVTDYISEGLRVGKIFQCYVPSEC